MLAVHVEQIQELSDGEREKLCGVDVIYHCRDTHFTLVLREDSEDLNGESESKSHWRDLVDELTRLRVVGVEDVFYALLEEMKEVCVRYGL